MFKALILHAQGWTPILSPQGKIAGIRTSTSLSNQALKAKSPTGTLSSLVESGCRQQG